MNVANKKTRTVPRKRRLTNSSKTGHGRRVIGGDNVTRSKRSGSSRRGPKKQTRAVKGAKPSRAPSKTPKSSKSPQKGDAMDASSFRSAAANRSSVHTAKKATADQIRTSLGISKRKMATIRAMLRKLENKGTIPKSKSWPE